VHGFYFKGTSEKSLKL